MKKPNIGHFALTMFMCILLVVPVTSGCSTYNNGNEEPTISSEIQKSNDIILEKADNNADIKSSNIYAKVSDFNKYNIAKEVYSRITTATYISDVQEDIGIPVLRKIDDIYYSVHSLKDNKGGLLYGFIMYKDSGRVIDGWCTDELHTIDNFSKLSLGDKIGAVTKIDPYNCLMENLSENTATSYHKLDNGKEYVIDYKRENADSEYKISYAREKDDPSNFTNILLKNDIDLIEG